MAQGSANPDFDIYIDADRRLLSGRRRLARGPPERRAAAVRYCNPPHCHRGAPRDGASPAGRLAPPPIHASRGRPVRAGLPPPSPSCAPGGEPVRRGRGCPRGPRRIGLLTNADVQSLTPHLPTCVVAVAPLPAGAGLWLRLHDGTTLTVPPGDLPPADMPPAALPRATEHAVYRACLARQRAGGVGQWGQGLGPLARRPGFRHACLMLEALSKFVDVLKASGWQTGAIALAAGLFLYLSKVGLLPPLEPWMLLIGWVIVFAFGALSAASLATACQNGVKAGWDWWQRRQARAAAERRFVEDIPTLTEDERQILGYLRHHRIRTFDSDIDGGYACTLLSKGYVRHVYGAQAVDRIPGAHARRRLRLADRQRAAGRFPAQASVEPGGRPPEPGRGPSMEDPLEPPIGNRRGNAINPGGRTCAVRR